MDRAQSVNDKLVFSLLVMRMLITLNGFTVSLILIWYGYDAFEFSNLSGCEQLVRCPTHIGGNRLDLVMTDVPGIVDVFVGTPLVTFDHCFVSCVFGLSNLYRSTISEVLSF